MYHTTPLYDFSLEACAEYDIDLTDLYDGRLSPRVPLFARVELPWHQTRAVRARDISLGGMSVLSRDGRLARHAGERLHMRFVLPTTGERIESIARVVAQSDAGNDLKLGLRFEGLSIHAATRIYQLIHHRRAA